LQIILTQLVQLQLTRTWSPQPSQCSKQDVSAHCCCIISAHTPQLWQRCAVHTSHIMSSIGAYLKCITCKDGLFLWLTNYKSDRTCSTSVCKQPFCASKQDHTRTPFFRQVPQWPSVSPRLCRVVLFPVPLQAQMLRVMVMLVQQCT